MIANIHNINLACLRSDYTRDITPKASFEDWWMRYGQYELSLSGPVFMEKLWEIAFACGEALGKRDYEKGYDAGYAEGHREGYEAGVEQ